MSQISLQDVTKRYGNLTTVERVSLEIGQGEFVAFLGPSGCGKTTTLRMIAGLTLASEGSIRFGARDVTDLPPYLRNAGLVFQGYALFPHMTVAENVMFGLEMRRIDRAQAQRRVQEALALVKLDHLADRGLGHLADALRSDDDRRRVGQARHGLAVAHLHRVPERMLELEQLAAPGFL